MKKILILFCTILISTLVNAQALKTRTDGTFTQGDTYLIGLKTLGAPFGTSPTLNGGLARDGQLYYSTVAKTLYIYDLATTTWVPASPNLGITNLTGDATGSGPGSTIITFTTVNSNVGTFGDANHVGSFTVNAKGLVTAASNTLIQITESQVTNLTTDLSAKQLLSNLQTTVTNSSSLYTSGSAVVAYAQQHEDQRLSTTNTPNFAGAIFTAQVNLNNTALALFGSNPISSPSGYATSAGLKYNLTGDGTHNYTQYGYNYITTDNGSTSFQLAIPQGIAGTFALTNQLTGGTVTSITPGFGHTSFTPITGTGTLTIDSTSLATRAYITRALGTIATAISDSYLRYSNSGANGSLFKVGNGALTDNYAGMVISKDFTSFNDPALIQPVLYIAAVGPTTGNSSTAWGTVGIRLEIDDPAGVTTGNKQNIFGIQNAVKPMIARTIPGVDDAANFLAVNVGIVAASDAYYVSAHQGVGVLDYNGGSFKSDAKSYQGVGLGGAYTYAFDAYNAGSTIINGGGAVMRAPNNTSVLSIRNAGNTNDIIALASTSGDILNFGNTINKGLNLSATPIATANNQSLDAITLTPTYNTASFTGTSRGLFKMTQPFLTGGSYTTTQNGVFRIESNTDVDFSFGVTSPTIRFEKADAGSGAFSLINYNGTTTVQGVNVDIYAASGGGTRDARFYSSGGVLFQNGGSYSDPGTGNYVFTGTIKSSVLSGGKLLISSGTSIAESSVTSTEAGYLSGVTSAIQTQLNSKATYSEGSWTPIETQIVGAVGRYEKFGNEVHAYFDFDVSVNASGTSFIIGGLPFTSGATVFGAVSFGYVGGSVVTTARVDISNTTITLYNGSTQTTELQVSGQHIAGVAIYKIN